MSKSEVLEIIINTFENGNKTAFAHAIDILPQSLNGWLKRGRIEYDTIYAAYPDINPVWLLTNGEEGDIKASEQAQAQEQENDINEELIRLRADNARLKENLEDLRAVIGITKKGSKVAV